MGQVETGHTGRERRRSRQARRALPLATAAVAGAALIPALHTFVYDDAGARRECVRLTVVSSPDKAGLIARQAGVYEAEEPMVADACVEVRVIAKTSAAAADALARGWDEVGDGPAPDVWSPDASVWLDLVGHRLRGQDGDPVVTKAPQPLARSAQVVALPHPMARAMGWPTRAIGWEDLVQLAAHEGGWRRLGRPEWGRFRLGKADPSLSTPALAATAVSYLAGVGAAAPLGTRHLTDEAASMAVRTLELSVEHYGDGHDPFLERLRRADEAGEELGPLSAVVADEQAVWAYNRGGPGVGGHGGEPPRIPLAAVYPAEGSLVADHPYAVLNLPWVDARTRRAASDFLAFLQRDRQQRRFQQAGFRDAEGQPGPEMRPAAGLLPDGARDRAWPEAAVVEAMLREWPEVRKRARLLLLVDTSPSMAEAAGGRRKATRLAVAARALAEALARRHPGDDVGLWTFPAPTGGAPYREVVPVQPVGTTVPGAAVAALGSLVTGPEEAPLDASLAAALEHLSATATGDRVTAVVLITDQTGREAFDDLEAMRERLGQARESGVWVWPVAVGAGPEALQPVAEGSGTRLYHAADPQQADAVLAAALANV